RDWSSDVCSSDLKKAAFQNATFSIARHVNRQRCSQRQQQPVDVLTFWSVDCGALAYSDQVPLQSGMAESQTTSPESPLVGVIMGSTSDWETMRHAHETLDQFAIPHECQVVSAHRTPQWMA